MKISAEKSITEFVVEDQRTIAVFESFGIDCRSNGSRTINEVCDERSILPNYLLEGLSNSVRDFIIEPIDLNTWRLDFLVDYIESKHHLFNKQIIPVIKKGMQSLAAKYKTMHPEICEIDALFEDLVTELFVMMKKEEQFIFPYARKLAKENVDNKKSSSECFGTIQNSIEEMLYDQDIESLRFERISELSSGFISPEKTDPQFQEIYDLLQKFEQDLQVHIQIETNILFPKLICLEKTLPGIAFGKSL